MPGPVSDSYEGPEDRAEDAARPSADRQITIATAMRFCHAHGKRWIVIASCDKTDGCLYVTTYGESGGDKMDAAKLGDLVGRMAGDMAQKTPFADFRTCDQADWAVERQQLSLALDLQARAIELAIAILAGQSDQADLCRQLRDAAAAAENVITPYRATVTPPPRDESGES